MPKIDRCLYGKECALCDQKLSQAAHGHCGAIHDRDGCWWVATIRDFGGVEALRRAKTNIRDGVKPSAA